MKYFKGLFGFLLFAILLLADSFPVPAADAASVNISLADSAYSRGNYDEALAIYEKIAKEEGVSPELYFNIGNASYKKGNTGEAVVAYLRALRLNPSLKEAKDNLTFLRSHVEDANHMELGNKKGNVSPEQPGFWRQLYINLAENHLSDKWAIWAVAAFILFIASISAYIWSDSVLIKKIGFFGSFILLLASAFFIAFAFIAASVFNSSDRGVIVDNKVSLHKSPGDPALVATPLHAGTEMTVLKTVDDKSNGKWYEVRLNSDVQGWLPAESFSLVNPGKHLVSDKDRE